MSSYLGFQPTQNPNYCFVSYNNEDADRVGSITQKLAESGINLWYDHGIDYGTDWETVITEKIHHAQAVVLFFTAGILQKRNSYVQKEYNLATRLYHKKVFVVLLDKIDPSQLPDDKAAWWMDINEKQCITGYEYTDQSVLVWDIMSALNGEHRAGAVPVSESKPQSPQKRRKGKVGKAIVAIILALALLLGSTFGAFAAFPELREQVPFVDELFQTYLPGLSGAPAKDTDETKTDEPETDEPAEDTTQEITEEPTTEAGSDQATSDEVTTDDIGEQSTEEQTQPHVHTWGNFTTLQAPTCTQSGRVQHSCECGETEEQTVDALGHTEVVDAAVAATCTQTGLTEGKHCSTCGEVFVAQQTVDALGHTEQVLAAVAPTCTKTGLTEGLHCSVCQKVFTAQQTVPASGHSFGDWQQTVAPTETTKGEKRRDCSVCDEYETAIVAELAHSHDAWDKITLEAVAPTCTHIGLTEGQKCSGCGEVLIAQQSIAALGHTEVVDAAVAATCTEAGLTEGKHCSVCDEILTAQQVLDALGHTEVVDAAVDATCTESGLTEGKHCSVCGEVLIAQTTVAAKGHTEVINAAVAATCTETGLTEGTHCSVCDTVLIAQSVLSAKGHTTVIDAAVAATCTKAGKTEGKHCSVCEEILTAQEVIDALGHTEVIDAAVAATCTEAGKTEGKHCSVCDTVLVAQSSISATGHTVSTWTSGGADGHYGQCATCDQSVYEGHSITDAKCGICGFVDSGSQPDTPSYEGDMVERIKFHSFDELNVMANGIVVDRPFAPVHSQEWDHVLYVNDATVDALVTNGWCCFVDADSCVFGYSIDGAAPVYLDKFTKEAEDVILSTAAYYGANAAQRLSIEIPIGDLQGAYEIALYAKYPDGTEEKFRTFDLIKTVICPEMSEDAPRFFLNAKQLYLGAGSNTAKRIDGAELRAEEKYLAVSGEGGLSWFDVIPGGSYVKSGRYLALKYRIATEAQASIALGSGDDVEFEYVSDGEWHLAILDLADYGVTQDDDGNYIVTALVFACFDNVDATVMDLGYIASFASAEAAQAYDATLGYDSIPWDETAPEALTHMGLSFMLNSDKQSYSIAGLGYCTERVLVLPSTYLGLPVTGITGRAFWKLDYIVHVTFPESITYIEQDAFAYCDNLTSVTISSGMEDIGNWVFFGSDNLTDIYYTGNESQWAAMSKGSSWITSSYTVHYNSAITDPEDIEIPEESTPEYTDRYAVDMNVEENQDVYMPAFTAAGIYYPVCLLGYDNTVYLGNLDLSSYSEVRISYSCDGTQVTADAFAASSSLDIGLKSENSSFGEETTSNYDGAIAYTDMVFSEYGWNGDGVRTATIDLSDITYSGDVWAAVHNPQGTQICIHSIHFMY